jgi:serine/threonine-protein kinase
VKAGANLDLLPANIHPRVREVVIRCLQKDLRKRYWSITEARYEIEQALADPGGVLVSPLTTAKPRKKLRLGLPWVAAIAILCIVVAGILGWNLRTPEPRHVVRFDYEPQQGQQFSNLSSYDLAVSPDGKQFVYSTNKGLYLRSVDQFNDNFIAGTDVFAYVPFFSPDGKWIGYFSEADQKLKKIAVNGGAPVTLCDVPSFAGASWNSDKTIVYCQYPTRNIMRISENGGTPELLVKATSGIPAQPQILPDYKSVLFTDIQTNPSRIMVQSLKSGESKELFAGDSARYLPTGHIIYTVGNSLTAIAFDLDTLETSGGPVPLIEDISERYGSALYAISDSGTLAYIPAIGDAAVVQNTLVWIDRNGKEEPLEAPPKAYSQPKISPDGKYLALTVATGNDEDIWIWDFVRRTLTRLTFDKVQDAYPVWTLDGKRIVFHTHKKDSQSNVCWKAADGTGEDELVGSLAEGGVFPWSWSVDGKTLVLTEGTAINATNIGVLSTAGDSKYRPLLQEKYSESQPSISSDGRWMAYTSDESGRYEIYVRPFPEVNKGKWQVSASGGDSPLWSRNGRELFYRSGDSIMTVAVQTEPAFKPGNAQTIFRGKYVSLSSPTDGNTWDIAQDGKHFLMIKEDSPASKAPLKINVVLNWTEELKQRVP